MKKITIFLLIFIIAFSFLPSSLIFEAKAESLSEVVGEQLEKIDLDELNSYIENLDNKPDSFSVFNIIRQLVEGEYSNEHFNSVLDFTIKILIRNVKNVLPCLFGIITIVIFCSIIQNSKSAYASESVSKAIFFAGYLAVLLLIFSQIIGIVQIFKNTINNIAKINEIMSPIMITLMIASGGSVSASVYTPTASLFSNVVINTINTLIVPLIVLIMILGLVENLSKEIRLTKLISFFVGTVKWVVGIIITVYGLFVTTQGVTSAVYDGVSIKAAKYAIANSIPIIGGFLKDGFDVVVAGSVIIKNSVGVACVFVLLITIISPVIYIGVFGLMLKLCAGICELISDNKIADLCQTTSKTLTLINVSILLVGFVFFISVLLMIFTANAFI